MPSREINLQPNVYYQIPLMPEEEPEMVGNPEQPLPVFTPDKAHAVLSHHRSQMITYSQLKLLPLPKATATWKPISFSRIINELYHNINQHDVIIDREQLAVSHDALKMFATFDLRYGDNGEYQAALGLRTSNNKTLSVQIAIGARVFVCDNMSFSGDMIALKRKHTAKLDITAEMAKGVDKYFKSYERFQGDIARLKGKMLLESDAERMIYTAFDKEILPVRLFHSVVKSYRDVRSHSHISQWQLHNCFTLHAHQLPPARKFKATTDIGKIFNL